MKKSIVLLLLISGILNAQENLKEYTASNGITYKIGDRIKLGKGIGGQGTFVYLKMAGWMAGTDTQIGSAYAGLNVDLKKIKKYKFKGAEKIIFTVGGGNLTNYSLEIEEAISVCEIIDCNGKPVDTIIESDKYDKLNKLKILLDNGTLTKEEFEIEKKKLLN